MSKLFSLQQRIAYTLLDKLEAGDIYLDRATLISKKVLELIPEQAADEKLHDVIRGLELIPELQGLHFGLVEEGSGI